MNLGRNKKLSVIVPAYQEEGTIEEALCRLVETLDPEIENFEIVVVSDGSTDDTVKNARKVEDPRIIISDYSQNRGKGYAIQHGFTKTSGDLVAFFDGDLDIHPESLLALISLLLITDAECVVGSKGHPNSVVSYPIARRVQSSVFKAIVNVIFNLKVRDTQTGVKIFRREVLSEYLPNVTNSGFSFDLELLARVATHHKVVEGPVILDYQFSSSIGLRIPFIMLWDIAKLRYKLCREKT